MYDTTHTVRELDRYRYVDTEPSSTQVPVLLLYGLMGGIGNWDDTITALSERGFRVIVPEFPIYSFPVRETNLAGLVEFVHEFSNAIGIEEAVIGGNSLGGHIAALFAHAHSDRTRALILTGASGIFEVDLGNSIMRRRDKKYLRSRIEKTFYDPAMCTHEMLEYVIEVINDRDRAVRLIRLARSVQNGSVRDLLPKISAKTLLIWGANDQITPLEVAETFHQGIPDSELRFIDRCGHAPMLEQPEEFNTLLIEFLERVIPEQKRAYA